MTDRERETRMDPFDRRSMLMGAGMAGLMSGLPAEALAQSTAQGNAVSESQAPSGPEPGVRHNIDFGVIGLDHAHIYGMTDAMIRGGGRPTAFFATDPAQIATFRKRYGNGVRLARSEEEILGDKSIRLIAGAPIPDLRAPLGIRAMRAGKDYLGDKPAITTLEQLAEVRRAVKETGRKFAIMYSERLEVRAAVHAGQLVDQGRIGKVIQTVNLAPARRAGPTGSGTRHAMAESSPTSAVTRPTSSSITPRPAARRSSRRRPAISAIPTSPNSRISAT